MYLNFKYILFLIIIVSILCVSCNTNKTVYLNPLEPFKFEDNGITFGIKPQQEYWIYFDPDKYSTGIDIILDTDKKPTFLEVTNLQVIIKDLDVLVSKENINIPINLQKTSNTSKNYWGYLDLRNIIYTSDIVNDYNKKHNDNLDSIEMYKKFNKVKNVVFVVDFNYEIDGQTYFSKINFKYQASKVTSNSFWDMLMSV